MRLQPLRSNRSNPIVETEGRKGGGEEKKARFALLVFILATLEKKLPETRLFVVLAVITPHTKLGNVVADANVSFPVWPFGKHCFGRKKNVFESGQKDFCFPDANVACETNVSQFSHPGNIKSSSKCCSWKVFPRSAVHVNSVSDLFRRQLAVCFRNKCFQV